MGGPKLSDGQDCLVYLVDLGVPVLIDCGAGPSWPKIEANIEAAGASPAAIHTLLLTHCHVDHIGAVAQVVASSSCRVVAHGLDAEAIESGDPGKTAASWYNLELPRVEVTRRVAGDEDRLELDGGALRLIHTPGHTPGSMVALLNDEGERVLFGQDIHGPFSPEFGSDIAAWRRSMERLLALEADVLCEGHYGIYRPAAEVRRFIEGHLSRHR